MAGRKKKSTSVSGKDEIQDKQPGLKNNQPDAQPVNIILDPVITLAEVSQLRELLLGHIGAREIQVDVSKVEHMDTAGLQLLLAFSKAIEKKGGNLNWTGRSPAYSGIAELLGLRAAAGVKEN